MNVRGKHVFWSNVLRCAGLILGLWGTVARADEAAVFDPQLNGNVYAAAVLPDGAIVLGGSFTRVHAPGSNVPLWRERLARFSSVGSVDTTFAPELNGEVRAIVALADGSFVVGGAFTQVAQDGLVYSRNGLARFDAAGRLDAFDPQLTGAAPGVPTVTALARQADGSLVVGGAFTSIAPAGGGAAVAQKFLARFDASGKLDATFAPAPNAMVWALAIAADGKIVVGGNFNTLTPPGGATVAHAKIVRLFSTGAPDESFAVSFDKRVRALAFESDGRLLVAGDFLNLQAADEDQSSTQLFVARLDAAGSRDGYFRPQPNAVVTSLAVQRDGKILLGGEFTQMRSPEADSAWSRSHLARVNRDSSMDSSFSPNPDGQVAAIALQADGSMVIGGYFTTVVGGSGTSIYRLRAARLQADGTPDERFGPAHDSSVSATLTLDDGRVLVGGSFNRWGGVTRTNLALVDASGVVDPDFAPVIDGTVSTIVRQSDGRIVIGGSFLTIDEVEQPYLARLEADGRLDPSFRPTPNASVNAIVLDASGNLTVGGTFTAFDKEPDNDDNDLTARYYLARVDATGGLLDYDPSAGGSINALVLEADGHLLVGGSFTYVAGETRNYFARLTSDGKMDTKFVPDPNGPVYAIARQSDGRVLVGGSFTAVALDDGEADDDDGDGLTDDDAQRASLFRLNADGSLDKTFTAGVDGSIYQIALQSDVSIVLAGAFNTYWPNGKNDDTTEFVQTNLLRLRVDGSRDETFAWETNSSVLHLEVQADNAILMGGQFTNVREVNGTLIEVGDPLVRLTAEGAFDASFRVQAPSGSGEYVGAIGLQPDGKLIVGGQFSRWTGSELSNLLRLNADGTLDTSYRVGADGEVRAIQVRTQDLATNAPRGPIAWLTSGGQHRADVSGAALSQLSGRVAVMLAEADGSVLVGGSFYNAFGTSGSNLARLLPSGTWDTTFRPEPNAAVTDLAIEADDQIIVTGAFTTMGTLSRAYVARISPAGVVDPGFVPVSAGSVKSVLVLDDGDLLVGGSFLTFNVDDGEGDDDDGDDATNDDTGQPYLARLNPDGTLDAAFKLKLNSAVNDLLLESDGRILVAGDFTSVTSTAGTAYSRSALMRITKAGDVDEAFDPRITGSVNALLRQANGKLVFGGSFAVLQLDDGEGDDDDSDEETNDDANRQNIGRLNADDSLDREFHPYVGAAVNSLAEDDGGNLLVGGSFRYVIPSGNTDDDYVTRNHLMRFTADGALDLGFNPNADDAVYAILPYKDGSIVVGGSFTTLLPEALVYVGGDFTTVGGLDLPRLARIQSDGNPDGTYTPAPDAAVNAFASEAGGTMLVGGEFQTIAGSPRAHLARLALNGSLDATFAPNVDGAVRALAVRPTGSIVIGGSFNHVGGEVRRGLARLAAAGSLDTTFAPTVDGGAVNAIAAQADGSVLVAGTFTTINGEAQAYLVRLDNEGAIDPTFRPAPSGPVHAVALRADGQIWVTGEFTSIGGVTRSRVARLSATGAVLGGAETGANDTGLAAALDVRGNLLVGGAFTMASDRSNYLIARFAGEVGRSDLMAVAADGSTVTWQPSGSGPALRGVTFELSTDGVTWQSIGRGTVDSTGVWRWSGGRVPVETTFQIRGRGLTPSTRFGSGGNIEVVWQFTGSTPSGYGYAPLVTLATSSTQSDKTEFASGTGSTANGGTGASSGSSSGSSGGTASGETGTNGTTGALTDSRFINLAVRTQVPSAGTLVEGFVLVGTEIQAVLLRAIGPSLTQFGVSNAMSAPQLAVYNSAGEELARVQGWGGDAALRTTMASVGAFALAADSEDAVVALNLPSGAYTMRVTDRSSGAGTVLAEVYDAGGATAQSRLVNVSSLGVAGTNGEAFITGLVLRGDATKRVLIRGVGPGIAALGVAETLADPVLTLRDAAGTVLASNDNWAANAAGELTVATATAAVGAFALSSGSTDAAMVVDLPAGVYTVTAQGADEASGTVLVEVYELQL